MQHTESHSCVASRLWTIKGIKPAQEPAPYIGRSLAEGTKVVHQLTVTCGTGNSFRFEGKCQGRLLSRARKPFR